MWLGFTLPSSARAEDSHRARRGTTLRGGTAVGFATFGDERMTALGGQIALGHKFGPLAVEAEYEHLELMEYRDGRNHDRGAMGRLGLNGRLYWGRIGESLEPRTLLLLFAEAGVGRQSGRFASGDEFTRHDLGLGGGWVLDHRADPYDRSIPFDYVGWHFGWRVMTSRQANHGPAFFAACRAGEGDCPDMELGPGYDVGLVVASSLTFSW